MKDLEQGIGNADGPKKKNTKQERSKGDLEIMSVTTFFWMVDRCHPFLRFKIDPAITDNYKCALSTILERTKTNTKDSKDPKSEHSYGGWGVAPIIDSFQGAMAAAGSETRTPGHYFVDRENAHNHEHHHKRTNEYMHPVVQHAQLQIKYEPEALKGFKRISLGPGKGHHWVKTYKPAEPGLLKRGWSYLTGAAVPSASENDIVSIPEFVIPEHGTNTDGTWWFPYERNLIVTAALRANTGELLPPEKQPSQKDIEVDGEGMQFLNDLDEDNKDVEGFRAWKRQKITSSNPKYPGSW
ncbi:hypothetical protein BU25DRAFT_220226 [Macroventuria anomochaeta]|uniref:Uncharacterized protein n=1 Tax=Macroventuria anomochaeta TaxID=301207 RepID=A0ACB6RL05_9PLEO|nr:uncharacterized protein BU25DRAFT_220226 [Macroventuria anomochaeta]KAF2622002.1 hypothetical protein BU25DRAFT_220226 [Macroventuria anomochaeta]